MSKGLIVGLCIIGVLVGFGIMFVGGLIGINNQCAAFEQTVIAQYNQNKNNYDNYFKKVKETAQIPDMYVADFKAVYDSMMAGRYGSEGSQAVFQWIQENNPQYDSSLYKQIQQVIEAGRNSFEANQKSLLDKKQVYQTMLNQFPDGFFAKLVGFPKLDLTQFSIVTSDITEQVFQDKKADPLIIR